MRKETAGMSSVAVRAHNRRLLLQLLRLRGEATRARLATDSGLSPAAVTNVVAELVQDGLVQEGGAAPAAKGHARLGRPGALLSLARGRNAVLAVQIGAGVLQVGVCDLEARLLASQLDRFASTAPPFEVLERAVVMLQNAVAAAGLDLADVVGVGVGAAGLVDRGQRVNLSSPTLGWTNVAMADFFEDALGLPTVVDHNVRAMAMGEMSYGLGRGLESLAFVYVRTGVGAGLVLGGRDYRGGTHGAVEFGHIRVEPGGEPCTCGSRGCLETVASDGIIRTKVAAAGLLEGIPAPEDGLPAAWVSALMQAAQQGDPQAVAIKDELVEHLATALLAVINLLNPQLIVLGGLLEELGEVILSPLREVIPPQVLPIVRDGIRIERATFGAEAGLVGAATVALGRYVFGEPVQLPLQAD